MRKKTVQTISAFAGLATIGGFLVQLTDPSASGGTSTSPGGPGTTSSVQVSGAPATATATASVPGATLAAADPPVWSGQFRITDRGVSLAGRAPTTPDPAFATIIFQPQKGTFTTNNSTPAGLWTESRDPTRADCAAAMGAQALSSAESRSIVYRAGLGLCISPFGGDGLAFVRVLAPPDATSAEAFGIIWAR